MKFFLDMNIPYSALDVFEKLNLEAVHARDVGLSRAGDDEIMEHAINNECILVSKDLGFANIIRFPVESHYGVIILRLPFFFKASQFVNVLRDFLSSVDVKDLQGAITIVKLGKYRIRKIE